MKNKNKSDFIKESLSNSVYANLFCSSTTKKYKLCLDAEWNMWKGLIRYPYTCIHKQVSSGYALLSDWARLGVMWLAGPVIWAYKHCSHIFLVFANLYFSILPLRPKHSRASVCIPPTWPTWPRVITHNFNQNIERVPVEIAT